MKTLMKGLSSCIIGLPAISATPFLRPCCLLLGSLPPLVLSQPLSTHHSFLLYEQHKLFETASQVGGNTWQAAASEKEFCYTQQWEAK